MYSTYSECPHVPLHVAHKSRVSAPRLYWGYRACRTTRAPTRPPLPPESPPPPPEGKLSLLYPLENHKTLYISHPSMLHLLGLRNPVVHHVQSCPPTAVQSRLRRPRYLPSPTTAAARTGRHRRQRAGRRPRTPPPLPPKAPPPLPS